MLRGRDIVIFGEDWGRYPSTLQHIGKILAESNRILWIGSLGLRKPRLTRSDARRAWSKLRGMMQSRPRTPGAGSVMPYHPFILPFHDCPGIGKLNAFLLTFQVQRMMRRLRFKNTILITGSPLVGLFADRISVRSRYYVVLDDFAKFDHAFKAISYAERRLLDVVDASFAVSNVLLESRRPRGGHSIFLPQGVDIEHFRRREEALPTVLQGIAKPIAGYFGLIARYVDLQLLIQVARLLPRVSFVLVGKFVVDGEPLKACPNIHATGEIPYGELPHVAQFFDVGIIPFELSELTIAANPLKLLEYLSLGLPVVSTPLPEVVKLQPSVAIATNAEDFASAITAAIENQSADARRDRRQIAEKFGWRSVAEKLSGVIAEVENEKDQIGSGRRRIEPAGRASTRGPADEGRR